MRLSGMRQNVSYIHMARIMFDVNDYSSEGYVRIDSLQLDEVE